MINEGTVEGFGCQKSARHAYFATTDVVLGAVRHLICVPETDGELVVSDVL
jgi:hypothetical protein